LQNYEATLEEMANASLDMKEELGAVEQWFRVLTEAERTAALYSLLQQATQVQIRFFLTVLQQMASKTPVNHLLSPASFEKGKGHVGRFFANIRRHATEIEFRDVTDVV
jgi:hypothetical protein